MPTTTRIRYMPLGDSITDDASWRFKLWSKLQESPYASVKFVGSLTRDTNCTTTADYERNHEGHSGCLAVDIARGGWLDAWLRANPADVVSMHLGTNDVVHMNTTEDIVAAYTALVGTMRACNPRMKIVVAQVLPIDLGGAYVEHIKELNAAIPAWARSLERKESPIWVVDQYTGIVSSDLRDGVHPSESGDEKMANVWYPALVKAFKAVEEDKSLTTEKEMGFEA